MPISKQFHPLDDANPPNSPKFLLALALPLTLILHSKPKQLIFTAKSFKARRMLKKILITLILTLTLTLTLRAAEGMWIPALLKSLNEKDMQAMGLKLTAEDIYSVNKSSLKDAIVLFGGGCTAEVISTQGLILTNHHCGFSQIQSHSSVEKDYLKDGFWAKSKDQELANPGLTATFIVRIEDVTAKILEGTDGLDVAARARGLARTFKRSKPQRRLPNPNIRRKSSRFSTGMSFT